MILFLTSMVILIYAGRGIFDHLRMKYRWWDDND